MAEAYAELKKKGEAAWNAVENPTRPQIFVGYGIHGLAAGAPEVMEALKKHAQAKGVQADLHITGGLGPDFAEVLVSIAKPSQPRVYFANITPENAPRLIDEYIVVGKLPKDLYYGAIGKIEGSGLASVFERPEFKLQNRIVTANCGIIDPTNILHYIGRGGYAALNKALFQMKPEDVVGQVEKANLRGRGGAAFPAGTKWRFLIGNPAPVKYMLCNGEEGDSGAFNDKHLLESDPHRVLEGIILGGYGTKSSGGKGFVFIRIGWDLPIARIQQAIEDCYKMGLLGKNILGSGFNYDIELAFTGESYVAGEETALMEAIEGKRAMPRYKPPFPAAAGLWQKPTNINNVKTYAYVSSIIMNGADWFTAVGTAKSKGTALVCLSGNINRPGLFEVPFGLTLRQVIYDVGGGVPNGKQLKFLQTGGPLGGFLPASSLDLQIDFDAMVGAGAMFGSGGIIVGDETVSVVEIAAILGEFNAEESCGKCFPCRIGTRQVADILERMAHKKGSQKELKAALTIGETMKASLCAHGQLADTPIKTGYKFFKAEFDASLGATVK